MEKGTVNTNLQFIKKILCIISGPGFDLCNHIDFIENASGQWHLRPKNINLAEIS